MEKLKQIQSSILASEELLRKQEKIQKNLFDQLLSCSKDVIKNSRLLSLIRVKIMKNKKSSFEKLSHSQIFQGLQFSKLKFCPSFLDPTQFNYYIFVINHLRHNYINFSKMIFEYSISYPKSTKQLAYSIMLSFFQQGWSEEEDNFLSQVLQTMIPLQKKLVNENFKWRNPMPRNSLRLSRFSVDYSIINSNLEPFATFFTAYFFNGASFAYLQSSLFPIILKLYTVYNERTNFSFKRPFVAPLSYLDTICQFACEILDSLEKCAELLPNGTLELLRTLSEQHFDLNLLFFESFINRVLDNPSILGLMPWCPSYEDWNPSHSIADVFRTKYGQSIPNFSLYPLKTICLSLESYKKINLEDFFSKLLQKKSTFLMSETELYSISPNFPKQLLLNGSDIILLHNVLINAIENENKDTFIKSSLKYLEYIPETIKEKNEHFKISVANKSVQVTDAKKSMDLFAERFSDFIDKIE